MIERGLATVYARGRWFPLLSDVLFWPLSSVITYIVMDAVSTGTDFWALLAASVSAGLVQTAIGSSMGLYSRRWRIASFDEASASGLAWGSASAATMLFVVASRSWGWTEPRMSAVLAMGTLAGGFMALSRIMWRRSWESSKRRKQRDNTRAIVLGARDGGIALIRAILQSPESEVLPVAILEDAPELQSREIEGVPVRGGLDDLEFVAAALSAEIVLISSDLDPSARQQIEATARDLGLSAVDVPALALRRTQERPPLELVAQTPDLGHHADAFGHTTHERARRFRLPSIVIALGDIVAVNITVATFIVFVSQHDLSVALQASLAVSLLFALLLFGFDLYGERWVPTRKVVQLLFRPLVLTVALLVAFSLVVPEWTVATPTLGTGVAISALGVLVWRVVASNLENRIRGRERVLIVVDRETTDAVDQRASLESLSVASPNHVELVAIVDYRQVDRVLAESENVDVVVLTAAVPSSHRSSLTVGLMALGVPVFLIPSSLDVALSTAGHSYFHTVEGIMLTDGDVPFFTAFAKRGIDVVVSMLLLVLLSPLMASIALAIRVDSDGKALFRQERVGKNQEVFTLFKFRSMGNRCGGRHGRCARHGR